jgi:hypothetical protein
MRSSADFRGSARMDPREFAKIRGLKEKRIRTMRPTVVQYFGTTRPLFLLFLTSAMIFASGWIFSEDILLRSNH